MTYKKPADLHRFRIESGQGEPFLLQQMQHNPNYYNSCQGKKQLFFCKKDFGIHQFLLENSTENERTLFCLFNSKGPHTVFRHIPNSPDETTLRYNPYAYFDISDNKRVPIRQWSKSGGSDKSMGCSDSVSLRS